MGVLLAVWETPGHGGNGLPRREVAVISSVLVLDRELGYMFALSQALRKRAIAAIPSCSVAEAEALVANLKPHLSVLLINCSCPGVCGFVTALRQRMKNLRVVGITSHKRSCKQCALDYTLQDPEDRRADGIERCAEMLHMLIRGEPYQ